MTRARNTSTNKIEFSHDLERFKSRTNLPKYCCPNNLCRSEAFPWAIGSDKRTPHFQYRNGHADRCHFEGMGTTSDKILGGGSSSFKLPYKSELVFPKVETVKKQDKDGGRTQGTIRANSNSRSSDTRTNKRQSQKTSLVGALAEFYLEDIDKHSNLPLKLLSKKTTYRGAFQNLWVRDGVRYNENFIFYSELKVFKPAVHQTNTIEVHLHTYCAESRCNYVLKLDTTEWSEPEKASVRSMLDITLQEGKKAYGKGDKAFTFFVGKQDNSEPYIFHCKLADFFHCSVYEPFELIENYFGIKSWKTSEKKVNNLLEPFEDRVTYKYNDNFDPDIENLSKELVEPLLEPMQELSENLPVPTLEAVDTAEIERDDKSLKQNGLSHPLPEQGEVSGHSETPINSEGTKVEKSENISNHDSDVFLKKEKNGVIQYFQKLVKKLGL
ncbi:hypothetical protein [Veronia pacifica]|uniref:Uncharacterized protein n=1 Tax=Veronia pacifica TaxID=1080227 RepID=A0A1C3EL26_9GAMM|nr:hypothetical protein [Veronia pacifica]ODA33943.1 hypothetical protein A8L45_07780 [Veronia pacifica]